MEIGSQKFGDEVAVVVSLDAPHFRDTRNVHVFQRRDKDITQADNLRSVSESLLSCYFLKKKEGKKTDVLMAEMLKQLQLPVGSLGQHRGAKRLHDFLDCDWLRCQLILRRAVRWAD